MYRVVHTRIPVSTLHLKHIYRGIRRTQRKNSEVTNAIGYNDCFRVNSAALVLESSLIFSDCLRRNFMMYVNRSYDNLCNSSHKQSDAEHQGSKSSLDGRAVTQRKMKERPSYTSKPQERSQIIRRYWRETAMKRTFSRSQGYQTEIYEDHATTVTKRHFAAHTHRELLSGRPGGETMHTLLSSVSASAGASLPVCVSPQ